MIFCRSAVVVCLIAGLISPLHSQVKPKPKITIPPGKELPVSVCPKGIKCVDLCALAAQLSAKDQPKPIRLEGLKENFSLADHDDISLSYDMKEQVVWTCSNQTFAIIGFQEVWQPGYAKNPSALPLPIFPFAPPQPYLNVVKQPGFLLCSGPPVIAAVGHRFKYTFLLGGTQGPDTTIFGGHKFDPHIIVTGGDGSRENGHDHEVCPHPDHDPKVGSRRVK